MSNPVGTLGMGDLSDFKSSKIPTLPSHKNVCQEKHCIAWTFPLSYHDKYIGEFNNFPMYERTTKWKCENGHRIDTTSRVDWEKKRLPQQDTRSTQKPAKASKRLPQPAPTTKKEDYK